MANEIRRINGTLTSMRSINGTIGSQGRVGGSLNRATVEYRTTDYNDLDNRPSIEGVVLEGDKTFEELNLQCLTNQELEAMLTL